MALGQSLLDTVLDAFSSPHPDGYKFIGGAVLAAIVAFVLGWELIGILALIAAALMSYVFRDPDRVVPLREGLVLAPADGTVTAIAKIVPPTELGLGTTERTRISSYLSVLDVHLNRAPVAGRVTRSIYVPGAFTAPPGDRAAEENERRAIVVSTPQGLDVAVVQISGGPARRLTSFVSEGDSLASGQRFGLIRFSARIDVYLPPEQAALVAVGQRLIAGETVIADARSAESAREARRV